MASYCWQPLTDEDISLLTKIIGENEFKKIENENLGKKVLHCYRTLNKSNRHCYSNYKPNMNNIYKFTGYNDRY